MATDREPDPLAAEEVTRILQELESGNRSAGEDLLPLIYKELRALAAAKIAAEKPGQTLQATALVHEAYLRLVDGRVSQHWESRGHFFSACAEAMRRILIENARRKQSLKRGGEWERAEVELADMPTQLTAGELIDLDDALNALSQEHPDKAKLVELRYFAGMTIEQAAEILGISRVTAHRHWTFAKAWLFLRLDGQTKENPENL